MSPKDVSEIVRLERNNYARIWRAKNPDKVRMANERYWLKRAKCKYEEEDNNESE